MSTIKSTPIARRKLSDEVLERLVDLIESGQLKAGDQMPSERELMETFNVGRPAVREALQSLASMGMITIQHGERARVTAVTAQSMINQIDRSARYLLSTFPKNVDHLKEARLFFEVGMIRVAAERAGPDDVARLEEAVREMERNLGKGRTFIEADMRFHRIIAEIPGNPIYAAVSQAMLQWLSEFHVDMVSFPGAEDVTLKEHYELLERVKANDPDGAAQAMTDHLTRASSLYTARARGER
ncbi:HTH-type transcriptional repressor NanR [wastewater metagenome]|uniref:HTH-type transcriptional repressor NanR n=2 Tax=unclassified sequences TaxID=12908 RepID=A0A5B8RBF7_9ZZZZ|nr:MULTISPECIES: transcriptional regulator NanR [Arhodomonas]MCS4504625.1 transcriptional regulator NanR [Arhodomonas aquaeolei]QEA04105.1 HTH-type transcriptional repressor NanR [uncultured organism]